VHRHRLLGLAVAIGVAAGAPDAAPAQPFAYVANLGSDDVSVIDSARLDTTATLPGGDDPDGVAISADGTRVYVSSFLSGTVTTIDARTQEVLATVPVGPGPVGLAVTPDGERVYVTRRGDDRVAALGVASGTVEAVIAVGRGPNAIAITPDGASAFVTNSFAPQAGAVSVLDLATDSVRSTITVGRKPSRIAIAPDGRTAYVTNYRSWTSTVIDVASETVRATFRGGLKSTGVAVNPNGAWAYVTEARRGQLLIIDLAVDQVTRAIDLGSHPTAIGVLRNGGTGYVTDFVDGSLRVVDLGDEEVVADLTVGERPFAVAVNCIDAGCRETPYTPKPTRTATETPTATPTATPSDTPTETVTPTATRTLPAGIGLVLFDLLADPTAAGEPTRLSLVLQTGGQAVHGIREQVALPTGVSVRGGATGLDCALDPALAAPRAEFSVIGCGPGCTALVIAVDFAQPLVDAHPVYTCGLSTARFLPVGTTRLRHLDNTALDGNGDSLPSRGRDAVLALAPPASPSPDLTPRPTRTLTPTAAPQIFVVGGAVDARPGQRAALTLQLDARGRAVAGVQNDLEFAPGIAVAARPNGRPDCTVNPAIDKRGTSFAFQPAHCTPGTDCTAMRALVLSLEAVDPIADGSPLYTCALELATDVAPGTYTLPIVLTEGSTPTGESIPTGAVDAVVSVLPPQAAGRQQAAATAPRVCAAGGRDGQACADDNNCPAGACVVPQGVCDGGEDDGLLCDCPGGACRAAGNACGADPDAGVCQGGEVDGACCDRTFACRDGSACKATRRLCAAGPAKGSPCLIDAHCLGTACVASGRRCAGGAFDGIACIDAPDCPAGTCIAPAGATPAAPPTIPKTVVSPTTAAADDGCAVVAGAQRRGAWWLLMPLLVLWRPPRPTRDRGLS
jgi:YVTN family beta-propeller protein